MSTKNQLDLLSRLANLFQKKFEFLGICSLQGRLKVVIAIFGVLDIVLFI